MRFKIIHPTYLELLKNADWNRERSWHRPHFPPLIAFSSPHLHPAVPPHHHHPRLLASSPLCLCRLSPIIVTTPHYLFFPTVALALFLYISLRGTRCVPRMIYSGADILAESACCGQDALFLFRCLKTVPTLIADANELLYISGFCIITVDIT